MIDILSPFEFVETIKEVWIWLNTLISSCLALVLQPATIWTTANNWNPKMRFGYTGFVLATSAFVASSQAQCPDYTKYSQVSSLVSEYCGGLNIWQYLPSRALMILVQADHWHCRI